MCIVPTELPIEGPILGYMTVLTKNQKSKIPTTGHQEEMHFLPSKRHVGHMIHEVLEVLGVAVSIRWALDNSLLILDRIGKREKEEDKEKEEEDNKGTEEKRRRIKGKMMD